jgi:O-antigen/teichoic acid export membrane protein
MAVGWPLSVLTAVLVARWLGPAGKGEYALAMLVGNLLLTLFCFGIPSSISYYLSSGRVPAGSMARTVIVAATLLWILCLALSVLLDRTGWCSFLFGVPRFSAAMWMAVFGLWFMFLGTFLQVVILALGRHVLYAALPAFGTLVVAVLSVLLIWLGVLTPALAVGVSMTSHLLNAAVMLVYTQIALDWWRASLLAPNLWKSLASYSLFHHAASIFQFLIQRVDVFMVSVMLDIRAVGLYSVAYGIAELLLLLPQRLGGLYHQRVAADRTPEGKADEVRVSSSLVFVGTALGAVALALAAPFGIRLLYGPAFAPAVTPFLLLLPGVCALATSCIQNAYLSGIGRPVTGAVVAAAGLAANVVLNLILIPRLGISGAAVASSLTYGAQALLLIATVARLTHARPLTMLTSAPPSLVAGILRRALQ